jgi:ribonuclease P protein component
MAFWSALKQKAAKGFYREGERRVGKNLVLKMLSRKYRLKKNKDFERVYKEGEGFKEDFLFLKVLANNLENPRIGIVVGKKVSNKATERNLIKRRLREAVRKRIPEVKNGLDIIIVVLKDASKEISFEEIEKVVNRLFLRAKIVSSSQIN